MNTPRYTFYTPITYFPPYLTPCLASEALTISICHSICSFVRWFALLIWVYGMMQLPVPHYDDDYPILFIAQCAIRTISCHGLVSTFPADIKIIDFSNAYQAWEGGGEVIDKRGGTINGQPRLSIMRGCSRSCLHFEYSFIYLQSKQFIFFLFLPPLPFSSLLSVCTSNVYWHGSLSYRLSVCVPVCVFDQPARSKQSDERATHLATAH